MLTLKKNHGLIKPSLRGIADASTFTGFCVRHDDDTFAPLEKKPFTFDIQQCFLLAYRALCKEVYAKTSQARANAIVRDTDRGLDFAGQRAIQDFASTSSLGISMGIKDIEESKRHYDSCLMSRDFGRVRFFALEFDRTPDIAVSGFFSPDRDFRHNLVQDLADHSVFAEQASFTILPTEDTGAAVLCWLESPAPLKFIESLREFDRESMPHALVRLTFSMFENYCLSPDWWENLSDEQKGWVNERTMMGASPFIEQKFVEDGVRLVDWKVKAIHTNLDP